VIAVLAQVEELPASETLPERDRIAGVPGRLSDLRPELHRRQPRKPRERCQLLPALLPRLRQVRGPELEGHHCAVTDQDPPVPVQDLAARRRHPDLANPVVIGDRPIVVARKHLQVPEPEQDHQQRRDHQSGQQRDPDGEPRAQARR
jgi:hypothetical protein